MKVMAVSLSLASGEGRSTPGRRPPLTRIQLGNFRAWFFGCAKFTQFLTSIDMRNTIRVSSRMRKRMPVWQWTPMSPFHPATAAAALLTGASAAADVSCPAPVFVNPAPRAVMSTLRPEIAWQGVAEASAYRLSLHSREAEGRTYARFDTWVEATRFVPALPLSDGTAQVIVRLYSRCREAATESPPAELRFQVDARASCPLAGLSLNSSRQVLAWSPTVGAESYDLHAYAASDGRLLYRQALADQRARLPADAPASGLVIAVRARCGATIGRPAFLAY